MVGWVGLGWLPFIFKQPFFTFDNLGYPEAVCVYFD